MSSLKSPAILLSHLLLLFACETTLLLGLAHQCKLHPCPRNPARRVRREAMTQHTSKPSSAV